MKKILPFIIIIILSYFAIRPLLAPGFFSVHDNAQPQRVFEMAQALRDGIFPVRWSKDMGFGYGYPLFNFYAPLAYYVGGFFMLFFGNVLTATKLMIGLGILLSGIFMYCLAKEFWGREGALVSAMLYVYAPYHAVDIYVRGDVAEAWGYAFVPLVFLGFYKLFIYFHENSKFKIQNSNLKFKIKNVWGWTAVASLSFAGLILSHNLTAMMITPFLLVTIGIYIFILYKQKKLSPLPFPLTPLFLGLALSAFYWLPVFSEMKYSNVLSQTGGGFDFHTNFVCLNQLWTSPWGYGGSAPGCVKDGLSFMIGKIHIILAFIALIASFVFYKKDRQHYAVWHTAVFLLIAVFLSIDASLPIWQAIHIMSFFQFPWRFLIMMSFCTSFIGGSIIYFTLYALRFTLVRKKLSVTNYLIFALLIIIIIFSYSKFFTPQKISPITPQQLITNKALSWDTARASSEYMPKNFAKPKSIKDLPKSIFSLPSMDGNISVGTGNQSKLQQLALVQVVSPTHLHINIAYFPTWHVRIQGVEVPIKQVNNGMEISLPAGKNGVSVIFEETPIENIANVISFAGIVILIAGIIFKSKSLSV